MDLGKTADGKSQAYLTFKLNNTTAEDLAMLKQRKHLQKLEVSKNRISDLSHLSGMQNLVYLNVSGVSSNTNKECLLAGTELRVCLLIGIINLGEGCFNGSCCCRQPAYTAPGYART